MPKALALAGTTGTVSEQIGGYLGATNPSLALRVADPDRALDVARILGHALSQDGMMVVSVARAAGQTSRARLTSPCQRAGG